MTHTHTSSFSPAAQLINLAATGGSLYYLLEILLRGFSHWTMAVCGALCLIAIYYMNRALHSSPLILRAALGAAIITAVELAAGYLLNIRLGLAIWDYSGYGAHLWGQICIFASVRWFFLCIPVCLGCGALERYVFERAPEQGVDPLSRKNPAEP